MSMRWSWKHDTYTYTVAIDGEVVKQHVIGGPYAHFTEVQTFLFTHDGLSYRVDFAPISIWSYGVHVYRDGALRYKYKGRDFVAEPRLKRFLSWMDRIIAKQEAQTAAEQAVPKKKSTPFWGLFLIGALSLYLSEFIANKSGLSGTWWAELGLMMAVIIAAIYVVEAVLNRPKAKRH